MQTNLDDAVDRYLRAKTLSRGTRNEYLSTLRKWGQWGGGVPIEQLQRKEVREFLDWVYQRAVEHGGGRTPVAPRTRPASTCAPCCRGRGSRS